MIAAARRAGYLQGDGRPDAEEEEDGRLSDEDLFAYLCRDGMGGFGGMAWSQYQATPDRILRDSYLAERDDDHAVITLRQRRRRQLESGGKSGSPELAGRELPSREELCIPAEAWAVNEQIAMTPSGQAYCLMYWSVWRRRQSENVLTEAGEPIDDAYILARWRKKASGR